MKNRQSNLELLRIISMCGIVVLHYLNSDLGGALQNASFPNFSWMFSHAANGFCVPLVNCFVLITGYFLVEKTVFSLRKSLDLLVVTAFYGLLSYIIWLLATGSRVSFSQILQALFPFITGRRWFVETYILLILFAPFLSALLKRLQEEHYRLLMIVQLTVFSLWYSLGLSAPILDDGYGIINFISLYMLGGYIRLHGKAVHGICGKPHGYLIVYLVCSLATFALSYFINPFGYAFFTNILGAVAIFLYFLNLDLGIRSGVNRLSTAAFDVYFVHSDPLTAKLLIYHLLQAKLVVDSPRMILHLLLVFPVIWLLGFVCCNLRNRLFSATIDKWLDKIPKLNQKINITI